MEININKYRESLQGKEKKTVSIKEKGLQTDNQDDSRGEKETERNKDKKYIERETREKQRGLEK